MTMIALPVIVIVWVLVWVRVSGRVGLVCLVMPTTNRRRETQRTRDMAMAPRMRMAMHQPTVAMFKKLRHPFGSG